jgi:hypothetical protein
MAVASGGRGDFPAAFILLCRDLIHAFSGSGELRSGKMPDFRKIALAEAK